MRTIIEDRLWGEFFRERRLSANTTNRFDGRIQKTIQHRAASVAFVKAIGIIRGLNDEDENAWDSLFEEADERYTAYREQ